METKGCKVKDQNEKRSKEERTVEREAEKGERGYNKKNKGLGKSKLREKGRVTMRKREREESNAENDQILLHRGRVTRERNKQNKLESSNFR